MTRPLIRGALRMRGRVIRWLPPRKAPHFFTDNPNRTHRGGYEVAKLGPPRLVAKERARAESANAGKS